MTSITTDFLEVKASDIERIPPFSDFKVDLGVLF